jgi:hypothetical protein
MLRDYRGATETLTMPVTMPTHASGPLTLMVSDAATLQGLEDRELKPGKATSWNALLDRMNGARHNNRVYVRLVSSSQGTVVAGDALPSLPASGAIDSRRGQDRGDRARCAHGRRFLGTTPESRGPRLARADTHINSKVTTSTETGFPSPMLQPRRLFLAALFAASLTLTGTASGPMFWTVASPAEFLKGTSDGIFVSLEGVLSPGPPSLTG